MKLLKIILTLIFFGGFLFTNAQIHLSEGFENYPGSDCWKPAGWTQEMASGNECWRFRNGGHSPNDNNWTVPPEEEDITRNPPSAYEGTFNAIFFKQGDNNERTKLITPEMDLLGAAGLELSFYLCQIPWTFEGVTGWDVLRIYYKTALEEPWVLLHEYLDPVYDWEQQTLTLPNPSQTYYVAFEGQTRWGYGTCIDNIVIQETASQSLYVGDIDFEQPFESYIPSGVTNVPIMRLAMKVFGNTDSAIMNQVQFTSMNSSDNDLQPAGVKLYSTTSQTFSTDHPLGSPTEFNAGLATFADLNYSLPAGLSYLWLTYDVAMDAQHEHMLDAKVAAHSIVVGDSLYPEVEQSPIGSRVIYETRYAEQFEGAHNWSLTGEFEVGTPDGSGGSPGNPNPSSAFSGTQSLGTDLTGLGANPYHYEPGLSDATSYLAISPTIDAVYYKNLNLFFRRYLNLEVWDHASIEVSADNGTTWSEIWDNNNNYISDFQWMMEQIPISDIYARTDQLKIRYKLGPTNGANNYSGWNIDDIFITGEFISKDVGVSEWIYPQSGSGHTSDDSVTVRITNYGGGEIVDPVPVAYSFDGGYSWTVDQMNQQIPVGGSVVFTFPTRTDLSEPGLRPSVLAKTTLPGDQFNANDQVALQLYMIPTYVPPYLEDFETGEGYWRPSGNQVWEYGTPSGNTISGAASGNGSWATGLTQQYGDQISEKGQIIFKDGFETDLGWTFTGEFERAIPNIGHLPQFAYLGYYCIGTDLSGLGTSPFLYENGVTPGNAYTATSPAIDVTPYANLGLEFASWIEIQAGDSIKLEVSPDNGNTWHLLWKNSEGAISEGEFQFWDIPIHDSLSFTEALRFRFSLHFSSGAGPVDAGWNVDDFLLTGDLVTHDPSFLASPSYNLTGMEDPVIEAKLWVDTELAKDGATLQYSLDDGESWTTISNSSGYDVYWNWFTGKPVASLGTNGWSGQSGGWMTIRHLLPAALHNQENVQFRFIFQADKINNEYDGIALDDLRIMEAPMDVDLLEILSPASACDLGSDQNFTLRMRNTGLSTLAAGDSLIIGYFIDRSGEIQTDEEILYLTENWSAGSTKDFNMSSQFDFSKSGDYQTEVYWIAEDPHFYQPLSGDTVTQIIQVRKPHVDLGENISTVRPDTVVLKAYSGVAGQSYLWQDMSTDSIFQVNVDGTYYVRVTNGLGCVASDTIEVLQLITDVGISAYNGPLSACLLGDQELMEITLENFGTDTVEIGNSIIVQGLLNQTDYFADTIILSERFTPGETIEFSYSRIFDFSLPGTYPLKLFTYLGNDVYAGNDTLEYMLEAYGYPDADLGPDTIVYAASYLLEPAPGYFEYLWQDGSTEETFTVDQSGLGQYYVTVRDIHQCQSADTVLVTLNVMDLELVELLSPSTSCELSENITISARIRNTGSVAIPSGEYIQLGYQIDEGPVELDGITLSAQLLPNHTLDFTFSNTETVVTGNWYDFTVFVDFSNDTKSWNDTVIQSVGVFETPDMDLGEEFQVVTTMEYILDPGPGFVSYEWHDGSTEQTFTVTEPGIHLYSVTVTDANGCTVYDEVNLNLAIPDIGISEVTHPTNNCRMGEDEHVQVAIQNYGYWDIDPPGAISVAYSVNGGDAIVEDVNLEETFASGSTIYHTFSLGADFSEPGRYEIMAYTLFASDLVPSNDIILVNADHFGSPVIDLGNGEDTLFISEPVTLIATPGYASYLWQDGSTETNFSISDPSAGMYSLVVTAENGCETFDSVYVVYDIPDLEIIRIVNPQTSCPLDQNSVVSIELVNNGYFRISTEDNITLTYSVNSGSSVIERWQLDSDLLPGESRIVDFSQTYNFSIPGDYQMQASLIYLEDRVGSNNLVTDNFTIWDLPEVDLGGGQDTIQPGLPTTLDAGSGFTSYLWQDNSTGTSLDVDQAGLYWVMVTDENGCVNRDTVIVEVGTSVRSMTSLPDGIRIYPNPVQETLNVVIEQKVEKDVILELYSINRSLIYREDLKQTQASEVKIDVQDLIPGSYYLRIQADGNLYNFLVIKE